MRAHGAAPGEFAALQAGRVITGNAANLSQLKLAPHIAERLAAEGVHSLKDWRALGRRRLAIWGVTRRIVAELDALARRRP